MMRFGLFHLMETPRGADFAAHEEQLAEQTACAEELGFAGVHLAEHHFDRDYGLCPSTMMYATRLAAVTKTIKIGSLVVVVPLSHPLRIAAEAAFADNLTGGRLILGLGAGYAPYEFSGLGVDLEQRREIYREGLEIIRRALSGETFSFEGEYFKFPELTVYPRPIQQPMPIWLTANSAGTAAYVGQQGTPMVLSGNSLPLETLRDLFRLYRQAWQEAGHVGRPFTALNRMMYVADSNRQAERDAASGTLAYLRRQASVFNAGKLLDPNAFTYSEFLNRMFTHGDPDTVAENIALLERELGIDYLVCKFYVNGLSHQQILASMRLFAREIMPRFR
jgi:alkanesulfonate monooxygenase SsuD/methylene tetrahydromethanopterin reductase-like flavin-dependent oxidoreductase (luciferase family)